MEWDDTLRKLVEQADPEKLRQLIIDYGSEDGDFEAAALAALGGDAKLRAERLHEDLHEAVKVFSDSEERERRVSRRLHNALLSFLSDARDKAEQGQSQLALEMTEQGFDALNDIADASDDPEEFEPYAKYLAAVMARAADGLDDRLSEKADWAERFLAQAYVPDIFCPDKVLWGAASLMVREQEDAFLEAASCLLRGKQRRDVSRRIHAMAQRSALADGSDVSGFDTAAKSGDHTVPSDGGSVRIARGSAVKQRKAVPVNAWQEAAGGNPVGLPAEPVEGDPGAELSAELVLHRMRRNPAQVFTTGPLLAEKFWPELAGIAEQELRKMSARGSTREQYRRIGSNLVVFAQFAGTDEALRLLDELIGQYPRRTAMREVLERTRVFLIRQARQSPGSDEWDEGGMLDWDGSFWPV